MWSAQSVPFVRCAPFPRGAVPDLAIVHQAFADAPTSEMVPGAVGSRQLLRSSRASAGIERDRITPGINGDRFALSVFDRAVVGLLPLVPKPLVRRFSRPYIAGTHLDDAIETIRGLNSAGMMGSLDVLGEHIATLADAGLSTSLHVDIGSPILRVSRTVLDVNGRPVQHILGQFRPDRYQIRLDLSSSRVGPELL